ncbi:unnamed protein product [Allacma fusca]|uniref:glucan endo-1,3-beta-D-glucosidase n=1 Tax=Allacma fusca TaxID=39272 RepID=A0A8J2M0X8_9HEXA|nr:unnamed protein product [Allacma fusca]
MIRKILFLALVSVAFRGSSVQSKQHVLASTGPRDDPISTTEPNLPGGRIAVDAPPGPFFQGLQPPFPTDAWWSGFTVGNQDATVAGPFPFQSKTTNLGLDFGISDHRAFDGTSIHVNTQLDWRAGYFGIPNNQNARKALSWDTQTVCLQYFNGGTTMESCLVPGSPYMTLKYRDAAVVLTSLNNDITNFQWVTPGKKAKVTHPGGTYLLYVVEGDLSALVANGDTLTSPAGFTGTIRLAKLKEASQEAVLDRHANTYPTGLTMSYSVAGDVSTQTWTWSTVGNAADLLILSWPHHRQVLQGANFVDIQYLTLKGQMRGVAGNTWVQRHNLPTISWFAQNAPHPSCIPELTKTVEAEVKALHVEIPGDFYFWGGSFGRAAQIATIAEHIGRIDLANQVVAILKQSVGYWFDPAHVPAAAFETAWGGFINREGWNNTWVDFGNAYYNDHHFHYGYLLHGAAVIGKYDPGWLNEHLDFFNHLARDVGNPSPNDPHYAVTRHFDFFAGHSWASGIANGAGPRDQESSGEAINGYYGLLLFAHATNNQPLIEWSRILVAMEIAGAQAYWHLYPNAGENDTPYPEKAFRDLVTVGNVMDTQTGAWLFWGAERIQIAAIQILPLTPIGQYTFDAPWMEQVLNYCMDELNNPAQGDAFKSVIYAAYAKVNPQRAYDYSANLFDWGTGNSASNQLYFVATQPSGADICSAASASPEGIFTIQDTASGKFVSTDANGKLSANTGADVLATKFRLEFVPGGGTIQSLANNKFVSASPDGTQPLAANRDTAGSYEIFRWASQPDGTHELTAMVNRKLVGTGGGGDLENNGAASKFRLVPSDNSNPPTIPAAGVLRSVQNNNFVVSTAANPVLTVNGNNGDATRFAFERVPGSPDSAPNYYVKNTVTNKYVTGNQAGTERLSALRDVPQAWESFQIVPYKDAYILVHVASGLAAALQGDNTIIDNDSAINTNAALWNIQ